MSARRVYLWVKYLKNITHYDDEDGWLTPEHKDMKRYSYRKILERSKCENDFFENIFDELRSSPEFAETFRRRNINEPAQLDYYALDPHCKYRLKS